MPVATDNDPESSGTRDTAPVKSVDRKFLHKLGSAIVSMALLSGLATYTILTGLTPVAPTPQVIVGLLVINLLLVLGMAGVIAWQIVILGIERRRGSAGARLHVRMITLFAFVAAMPALIVALFASVTLERGLDRWFSERTRSIVETALVVAEAYIQEHGQVIRTDIAAMANDLDRFHELYTSDRPRFDRLFRAQAALRGLNGTFLIDGDLKILARAINGPEAEWRGPTREAMERADKGELVILSPNDSNQVRALVRLKSFDGTFLYVFRFVDPRVLDHLRKTQASKVEYDSMEERRFGVQITFALMYVGVALIFLLAAIWLGLWFADRLVKPIGKLIGAARQVSEGNLDAKVSIRKVHGDLATLARTFNEMMDQLATQRQDLIGANEMLDSRRLFTEAVLSGVTAGVIGLDQDGRVTLVNRSALALLEREQHDLMDNALSEAVPEMAAVIARAKSKAWGFSEGHITIRSGDHESSFTVRVTREQAGKDEHGYVVTFDDITELVTAQRNSAWADIARRVAHEIKNPLTPIQLSAERLKRKYGKDIKGDRDVFEQCIETIVRQVGDIGRMVDEFSTFARMPKAVMEKRDICDVTRQAVFLQRVSSSNIAFDVRLPDEAISIDFDRRLVTQALTNLVKNATEAIEARAAQDGEDFKGKLAVSLNRRGKWIDIDVADNGIGLPNQNRQRLAEPYMTTREKGTGLGLAIVKKIMEEHSGKLSLHDSPDVAKGGSGAMVRLAFPAGDGPGPDKGRDGKESAQDEQHLVAAK